VVKLNATPSSEEDLTNKFLKVIDLAVCLSELSTVSQINTIENHIF
jgi:hypothetical protein